MRNLDFDGIGRVGAIISSILLMAIWLNVWVLKSTAQESTVMRTNFPQMQETPELVHSVEDNLQRNSANKAVWLRNAISKVKPEEKNAVAYLFANELYMISSTGRILALADSVQHQNLPIISGLHLQQIKVDSVLQNDEIHQALAFIECAQHHAQISPLISEVKVQNNNELIVYLNWGSVIPVKLGTGNWANKLDRLYIYYQQLGNTELTKTAKYLDLRVEDRIIIKKNV